MSNPRVKRERAKTKDHRQSPALDLPIRSKSKKNKPVAVYYRWIKPLFDDMDDWYLLGRYRSAEEAEEAIKNEERKYPKTFAFDIKKTRKKR
ncbi:hypothetical protein [Marinobacterium sp. BA1]|uniref:hypothetical protein n=1 Tax=Marinobacterium sp. BA1 TaxID=3138931 RepID=UPI0032E72B3F